MLTYFYYHVSDLCVVFEPKIAFLQTSGRRNETLVETWKLEAVQDELDKQPNLEDLDFLH